MTNFFSKKIIKNSKQEDYFYCKRQNNVLKMEKRDGEKTKKKAIGHQQKNGRTGTSPDWPTEKKFEPRKSDSSISCNML